MMYIGIDPGLQGGISILHEDKLLFCSATPTIKTTKGSKLDLTKMRAILRSAMEKGECQAFIEQVGARPGQGVTSMFTFGKGTGIWIGMLAMAEIPFTEVMPQAWKKEMLKGLDKKDKASSIIRAMQLVPYFEFKATDRSTTRHDGMAESYLIAEYGRRSR